MFITSPSSAKPDYDLLARQLSSILESEDDLIANASQFSAFIFDTIADLNWAGFYFTRPSKAGQQEELLLGPFQGKVACVRIPFSRGVCGAAATQRQTQNIMDVDAFPGHIACDSASKSEVVIPLIKGDRVVGVFDIDSPLTARFSAEDQQGLERLVSIFMAATKWQITI